MKRQENQLQNCLQGVIESETSCSEKLVKLIKAIDSSKENCVENKKELEESKECLDNENSKNKGVENDLTKNPRKWTKL